MACQSASFDPHTGDLLRHYTHKGVGDDSTWNRAQAWAMVGYALMYLWTRERECLDVARVPADLCEVVEVRLLPVGSKAFLSPTHLEQLFQELAEKSKQHLTPDNKPVDFSRSIKDWAKKYGFNAQQAKAEIDKWIAEVNTHEDDPAKLGLAAFAEKNFRKASQFFNKSATQKELAELHQEQETVMGLSVTSGAKGTRMPIAIGSMTPSSPISGLWAMCLKRIDPKTGRPP